MSTCCSLLPESVQKSNNIHQSCVDFNVLILAQRSNMDKDELRAVIKYLYRNGKSAIEIQKSILDTYGFKTCSFATICRWINYFKWGRESVKDETRPGRPKTERSDEKVKLVLNKITEDRRITVAEIATSTGLSTSTVKRIIKNDLGLNKVSARWVPKMLSEEQKLRRVQISKRLLDMYFEDEENFISRFVTMDETWVFHYDPESKQQSMEWRKPGERPPRKFKVVTSAKKIMLSVFWDAKGIIMTDYLPHGKTITGKYYSDLIRKLRIAIKEKRRGLLRRGVLFHQDNAPVHTCALATAAIEECGFELIEHPAYSPDLAPSDYYLFPNLKKDIRGIRFEDDNAVQNAVFDWFEGRSEEFYKLGIMKLPDRWNKCVQVKGDYVEK